MTVWVCRGCTAAYSVGAPRCPQCGADDHQEEGQDMPKITRHGGASNAAMDAEGGEESSPGKSSSTSSAKAPSSPRTSKHEDRSPARTTGNRSPKGRMGSSTAGGTDGGQTADSSDGDG